MWKASRGDLPSLSISSLATAPPNNLTAVDTNTEAIEITRQTNDEADNNTVSSYPNSNEDDGKGGREIISTEHANKSFAGIFSTQLKDNAARSARDSKQKRLQRGCWRKNSKGMTYEERQ
jgi:hypothetical protein